MAEVSTEQLNQDLMELHSWLNHNRHTAHENLVRLCEVTIDHIEKEILKRQYTED